MDEGRQPQHTGQKFCVNCGAELEPDSNFCGTCGTLTSGSQIQPIPLATETMSRPEYMGFWIRLLAWVVDTVLIVVVNLLLARFGLNLLTFFVGPV
jgi:uncharacterized membrane protein YvbJ